jgi:hypothetical protein
MLKPSTKHPQQTEADKTAYETGSGISKYGSKRERGSQTRIK